MNSDFEELSRSSVDSYRAMLEKFRPCKPGSEFLEQNLITLFAHEYLKKFPDGAFFSEVPFRSDLKGKDWELRLDAFAFTSQTAYAIEAKGSKSKSKLFEEIGKDLKRLTSPALISSLREMFEAREHILPNIIKGVVLADCWSESTAEIWRLKSSEFSAFIDPSTINTSSIYIGKYGGYKYFLLVGQLIESIDKSK